MQSHFFHTSLEQVGVKNSSVQVELEFLAKNNLQPSDFQNPVLLGSSNFFAGPCGMKFNSHTLMQLLRCGQSHWETHVTVIVLTLF